MVNLGGSWRPLSPSLSYGINFYTCSNKPNIIVLFCSDAFSVVWIYQERLVCWGIYIYKVVISVCLFVCLSDHNSGTPGPIVLKF